MSWLNTLDSVPFSITTGDSKVFNPLWQNSDVSKEFNTSVNTFINLKGSKVDRKLPKGGNHTLTFWFDGEDHISVSDSFYKSADDPRYWKVRHPFYGDLYGQPLSLTRGNKFLGSTEFTVEFMESITNIAPSNSVSPVDSVVERCRGYIDTSSETYSTKVNLKPKDLNAVKDNTNKINSRFKDLINKESYSEYQKYKSNLFSQVDDLILKPVDTIKAIQELINLPANLLLSVSIRTGLIEAIFNDILELLGIETNTNNKAYFEANAGAAIASYCVAVITPLSGDYITRTDVQNNISSLQRIYQSYLENLDNSQLEISDNEDFFYPSVSIQSQIQNMVFETIGNLQIIAFESRQERYVTLDFDSNIIPIVHKYVGLDENDENLENFRIINNIRNKNLFLLKKGRIIKYLV